MKNTIYTALRSVLVAALLLPVIGCSRQYELKLPLATSTDEMFVSKSAGQAYFIVYSTHDWSVELERPVEWVRLSAASGKGNEQIDIEYDENSDISRGVNIVVRSAGKTKTVYFAQAAGMSEPVYAFVNRSVGLLQGAVEVSVAATTNLTESSIRNARTSVVYGDDADGIWIHDVKVEFERVLFTVDENASGFDRMAQISVVIDGAYEGDGTSTSLWVTQSAESAYVRFSRDSYAVDPAGEDLELAFESNFASSALYGYEITYTLENADGGSVEWITDAVIEGAVFKAKAAPNKYEPRTAYLTVRFTDANGVEHSSNRLTLTQEKTTAGIVDGDNGDGQETKDPETDF